MRITLTSRDPKAIGGVQTWNRIMRQAFEHMGHMVVSKHQHADLGIMASGVFPENARFVLQVCHGIVEHEKPDPRAHACAFVSEEARDHWGERGPVIRQPLRYGAPVPKVSNTVVRFSYYGGLEWLGPMVEKAGAQFVHLKDAVGPHALHEHAPYLVIASGRSALEAAALGYPVFVFDHRPYQGPKMAGFLADCYEQEIRCSVAGRTDPGNTSHRLEMGNALKGPFPSFYPPTEDHDPITNADALLHIWREKNNTQYLNHGT